MLKDTWAELNRSRSCPKFYPCPCSRFASNLYGYHKQAWPTSCYVYQMTILQDTVRRECEERLELTQALSDARIQLLSSQSPVVSRDSPSAKNHSRVVNRPSLTKHSDFKHSSISEVNTSFVNVGYERKVKSTGSETSRPTRESVDSFRERIAAALGRQSRSNHTRWHCENLVTEFARWVADVNPKVVAEQTTSSNTNIGVVSCQHRQTDYDVGRNSYFQVKYSCNVRSLMLVYM